MKPNYSPDQISTALSIMASVSGITLKAVLNPAILDRKVTATRALLTKFLVEQLGYSRSVAGSFIGRDRTWSYCTIRNINNRMEFDRDLMILYAEMVDAGHEAIESTSLAVSEAA